MDNQKIESESQSGRGGGSQFSANLDSSGGIQASDMIAWNYNRLRSGARSNTVHLHKNHLNVAIPRDRFGPAAHRIIAHLLQGSRIGMDST